LSLVGDAAVFGLVDAVVQQSGEEALLRLGTGSSVDVGSTFALSCGDVARVVVRTAWIAVARFASVAGV